MNTIFTKIIKKEIPGYILYEDKIVIVFLDIIQATQGHTLVATKEEYINIQDIPENVFQHIFMIVHKISKVLIKTFNCSGINLLNNNGLISGQTIQHYHVHLFPRFSSEELKIIFNDNSNKLKKNDYEKIRDKILKNL
ncbi:MAG: HIT family protein [Candidatus Phytoplasma stylosanthis]|uniref:HIT family protein n=1 Tax=Candidatus Phytoplasma stylosanthis TaxID=2798314 RepID=UPI00293B7897|nr:HIT family protein [Candidatus Phytoplasma stylosanthis]MDV3168126.1 HIT family protein [Candidatus Phytoplasma stylosanthis]MDV3171109.1 HIT family protein [Candidatus Phytoplasma stylosanthis]MDV3174315.1 HIT family protein [Candidatus Phytoplasma stylosanthis]MDV3202634.1 HIT family protein [Candidatus Phytoplasma stylosanthis]